MPCLIVPCNHWLSDRRMLLVGYDIRRHHLLGYLKSVLVYRSSCAARKIRRRSGV